MSVRTIVEHGCPLTVQTLERVDALGATYWQARAMFRTASGQARVDVVTRTRHATREAAERAALALARDNGWGRAQVVAAACGGERSGSAPRPLQESHDRPRRTPS